MYKAEIILYNGDCKTTDIFNNPKAAIAKAFIDWDSYILEVALLQKIGKDWIYID